MPIDEFESKISTLNPLFLQAARDEAARGGKDEQVASLILPFARTETEAGADIAALEQPVTIELFQPPEPFIDEPEMAEANRQGLSGDRAAAKATIIKIQAKIQQTQQQLDRAIKIKATVDPAERATTNANLNELRLKRLAIQMSLVADGKEYADKDLLAVDKQIADLSGRAASHRPPAPPANTVESIRLNERIKDLRNTVNVLTEELNAHISDYNLSVAYHKAERYVQTLKAANDMRHDLLALIEALAGDGRLIDLNLGGELPIPYGFEPFDAISQDALATTIEGIELAMARIQSEILL